MNEQTTIYIRNIIFGVEDSVVSTVGLLAGISMHTPRSIILLTGIVYVCVEGFSMAVGSFLSEEAAEEYALHESAGLRRAIAGSVVMFFSFVAAGLIPIVPYLLIPTPSATAASIVASILALFALGLASGRFARTDPWSRGVRMAILGGLAILIGLAVGKIVSV